jgi:hypothetical protein
MSDVLWAAAAIVGCLGMLALSYAIEPHWVAKDGRRFVTTCQVVDRHGKRVGRRREVRGTVMGDGTLLLGKRTLMRTRRAVYRVRDKSPDLSRRRQQYLLERVPTDPMGDVVVLRVPRTSRLVAMLDRLAEHSSPSAEES